jgi:hypothetical protein
MVVTWDLTYLSWNQPGQTQSMLFSADGSSGQFWMTQTERDQKRHDLVLEGQTITR